jgi:uncharacterized protein with GYD domain
MYEYRESRRYDMAKYLVRANYAVDGLKGLIQEGATGRREAVDKTIRSMGGTMEAFYYAFGDTDVFAIVDLPDHVSAAALSFIANVAGMSHTTTVLLTAEEVDQAAALTKQKMAEYRAPGQ